MADYLALDAKKVEQHINHLIAAYPELADDTELLADMAEGETDLESVVMRALSKKQDAAAMVNAIKEREADLKARRDRFQRQNEAMSKLIFRLMTACKSDKLVLPEATISITKPRQTVTVTDADALPQGFVQIVRQPDKKALGEALKAGEQIPGAELALGEPGLTIRPK